MRQWRCPLGWALAAAMVLWLGLRLEAIGWTAVWRALPNSPVFYALVLAAYLVLPLADALIYRRLWGTRLRGSFGPFFRKRVYNSALVGYAPSLVSGLEALVGVASHAELRFKSEHPDNLPDLLVADVMVSNLSSFLAYHYVSGRPAIHIVPRRDKPVERVAMLLSRFRVRRTVKADEAWMIDPSDTGGVRVSCTEDTLHAVNAALDDPRPGAEAAAAWLARHIPRQDGNAAQRIKDLLLAMCATPTSMRRSEVSQVGSKDVEPPDCGTARVVAS